MLIEVKRKTQSTWATLGDIFVNGAYECHSLELPTGDGGHGFAIPAGSYQVIINMSPRLGRMMMRLLNVPGRDGILIHSLNDASQTEGCIGVGQVIDGPDHIHGGSVELPILQAKVQAALNAGQKVTITVTNEFQAAS